MRPPVRAPGSAVHLRHFCIASRSTGPPAGVPARAVRAVHRAYRARPGGQGPVARIECRGGRRSAWLYRTDRAEPKLPTTLAEEAALDRAVAARTTCPVCRRRYHHALPLRTLGSWLLRTTRVVL